MKITKLFLVIVATCLCNLMFGQTNQSAEKTIQEIRKEYNLVKSQIATLEKDGYAGELFCLHTIDNKYGKSYPGVGEYRGEIFFYYEAEGGYPPILCMVIEKVKSAGNTIYFEALYNEEGQVLFIFEKNEYDNNIAKRFYFKYGSIVKYSENNVDIKLDTISDETIWIYRAASAHKTRFDLFFEVE
jgi:hypothetical protein